MKDIVPLPEDYNIEHNLAFLQRSEREILHRVSDNTIFKAVRFGRRKILLQIDFEESVFIISYPGKTPTDAERLLAISYVQEWFDLENDLSAFYRKAMRDPILKPVVTKYKGYRIVGQPDLFESLAWAIIGQQINLSFAYSLKQRLVETFGEQLKLNENTFYLFPTYRVLAAVAEIELIAMQFSRQKAHYLKLLSEAFLSGEISKEKIAALSFEEAKARLMSVKGIGNWTANYALMKTFRYKEAFPLEDAGVHNALKNLQKLAVKPSLSEVKKYFEKYRGWEAYATLYLWKSL